MMDRTVWILNENSMASPCDLITISDQLSNNDKTVWRLWREFKENKEEKWSGAGIFIKIMRVLRFWADLDAAIKFL